MEKNLTLVKCPNCGNEFSAESAIENQLREQLQKEFQQKNKEQSEELKKQKDEIEKEKSRVEKWKAEESDMIKKKLDEEREKMKDEMRKKAAEDFDLQMQALQKENTEKADKLKVLQQKELDFLQKMKEINDREQTLELDFQKRINEREEQIKKEVEKIAEQKAELQLKQKENELKRKQEEMDVMIERKSMEAAEKARTEEQLKTAELNKQLDDQKKLIEEMRKKSEQGSMQMQGEVQELQIESILKSIFPYDRIEEVGKGIRGADCIQIVLNSLGKECGKIIYESKRTKAFSNEWITKLKEDMRSVNADLAVIVSEALPKDLVRFSMMDGVWVCTFAELRSVAMILRDSLQRVSQAIASQENKGDKMQMLYDYLTGNEFRQRVEGIMEGFNTMQDDLLKERKSIMSQWEKRQKQLDKVLQNTIAMYGSVKGIAGGAVQEIKGLELDDEEKLLL
ncbi:MAG: DUF2130 domain-containing protein [Bacteroidia bacterium]